MAVIRRSASGGSRFRRQAKDDSGMSTDRCRHGGALLLVLTEGLGAWTILTFRARVGFALGQSPAGDQAGDSGLPDLAGASVRGEAWTGSVFQRPMK